MEVEVQMKIHKPNLLWWFIAEFQLLQDVQGRNIVKACLIVLNDGNLNL